MNRHEDKEDDMNGLSRAGVTLLGLAAAGALLWVAAQIGRGTTGGYWAAYGIVAGAGVVLAATQIRGRTGHPPAMLALFLPVLVAAGWILLAMQPNNNWFRGHVLAWSGHMGIRDVVTDVGTWIGVLAFGVGYTLGLVLEPMPKRAATAASTPVRTHDPTAADEPVTAERREVPERETVKAHSAL
jgi:hypothetical protein